MEKKLLRGKILGDLSSLDNNIPWTAGLSSMFEWITWGPKRVLGVSTREFIKKIIRICYENSTSDYTEQEILEIVEAAFKKERDNNAIFDICKKPTIGLATPYEALRRYRYHSEEYLNHELDTFFYLIDSEYLDILYSQYFNFQKGNIWKCFGNSGILNNSLGLGYMRPDNLAYNKDSSILIANELKLGASKSNDQILKYVSMYIDMKERGFIKDNTKQFNILLFETSEYRYDADMVLRQEFNYCEAKSNKWYLRNKSKIQAVAPNIELKNMSWGEFVKFNDRYIESLPKHSETLIKLIAGMNASLKEKCPVINN